MSQSLEFTSESSVFRVTSVDLADSDLVSDLFYTTTNMNYIFKMLLLLCLNLLLLMPMHGMSAGCGHQKKTKTTVHTAAPPTCFRLAPQLMMENRTCNILSMYCDSGEGNSSTDCNFMIFILITMTEGR